MPDCDCPLCKAGIPVKKPVQTVRAWTEDGKEIGLELSPETYDKIKAFAALRAGSDE